MNDWKSSHEQHQNVCVKVAEFFRNMGYETGVEKPLQRKFMNVLNESGKNVPRPRLDVLVSKEDEVINVEVEKVKPNNDFEERKSKISIVYPGIKVIPCFFPDFLYNTKEFLIIDNEGNVRWFRLEEISQSSFYKG